MIYFARDIKRSRNFFLNDSELMSYASDILTHPEFYDMGKRTAHKYESRQKHLLNVAYYALKFSRRSKKLDRRAIVRSALLHDFYPYQRFKKYTGYREHVKRHPQEALEHSMKLFELSDKERSIISCHMWPWAPEKPSCKEALPVILADNFAAIMENFYHRAWKQPKKGVKKVAIKTKAVGKKAVGGTVKVASKVKNTGKTKVQHAIINHQLRKVMRIINKANKKELKRLKKARASS